MKLKLLIATSDKDYAEHLSGHLSDKHGDTFEIGVASKKDNFAELLKSNRYDVALLDMEFATSTGLNAIRLPFVLVDNSATINDCELLQMRKYQRISFMVGEMLETFAKENPGVQGMGTSGGRITAVWSPVGGVGKTTVALAYAANCVTAGKRSVYLSLENFASTHAYFQAEGRSISKALEKLDSKESNSQMLMLGMRQQDSDTGIFYFVEPDNYDDMAVLAPDDIETLVSACIAETDELIIDLSSQYNPNVMKVFDMANVVYIVTDANIISQTKLRQFTEQHSTFEQIQGKAMLVNNRGAKVNSSKIENSIHLPTVPTTDHISVYKSLSGVSFK